jgi:hypothetical protein
LDAAKAKTALKAKRKADIRAGKDESHKRIDASVLAALALGAAGAVLLANVMPKGGFGGGKKKKKTRRGSKSGASTPGSISGVSDVTLGGSSLNVTPRTDLTHSGSHLEITNYPSSLNTTPAGTGTPFSITGHRRVVHRRWKQPREHAQDIHRRRFIPHEHRADDGQQGVVADEVQPIRR